MKTNGPPGNSGWGDLPAHNESNDVVPTTIRADLGFEEVTGPDMLPDGGSRIQNASELNNLREIMKKRVENKGPDSDSPFIDDQAHTRNNSGASPSTPPSTGSLLERTFAATDYNDDSLTDFVETLPEFMDTPVTGMKPSSGYADSDIPDIETPGFSQTLPGQHKDDDHIPTYPVRLNPQSERPVAPINPQTYDPEAAYRIAQEAQRRHQNQVTPVQAEAVAQPPQQVPTLVEVVNPPQQKLISRNPIRGRWFNPVRKMQEPGKDLQIVEDVTPQQESEDQRKRQLAESAYQVAKRAQENHLQKLEQEKQATHTNKPKLRGNIFSNGFKKVLKRIQTFKRSTFEKHEDAKLEEEIRARKEYDQERRPYLLNHGDAEDIDMMFLADQDEDKQLMDKNTLDTFLADQDDRDEIRELTRKPGPEVAIPGITVSVVDELHKKYTEEEKKKREAIEVEAQVVKERRIIEGLDKITERTSERRYEVFEKLGPYGVKLLNSLDRGAHFLDRQVRKEIRIGTGVGLACAGALALYATPALGTIAVITAAGIGARVLAASAAYVGLKRVIDNLADSAEDFNKNRRDDDDPLKDFKVDGTVRKFGALSAAFGAAMVGQLIGEHLAPVLGKVLHEYFPHINDTITTFTRGVVPGPPTVPDVAPPAPVPNVVEVATPPVVAPSVIETAAATVTPDLFHHTVKPGENLWTIVRKTLEATNVDFTGLNPGAQESMIAEMMAKLPKDPRDYGITSGNINIITPGTVIDLTKAFTK